MAVHRKVADNAKRLRDSDRMVSYPANSVIKVEVRKAMGRLQVIQQHVIAEAYLHDMPMELRIEAAVNVVGIIFFNSFAGRAGSRARLCARQHAATPCE
jgi:hypothetical protein